MGIFDVSSKADLQPA